VKVRADSALQIHVAPWCWVTNAWELSFGSIKIVGVLFAA